MCQHTTDLSRDLPVMPQTVQTVQFGGEDDIRDKLSDLG